MSVCNTLLHCEGKVAQNTNTKLFKSEEGKSSD